MEGQVIHYNDEKGYGFISVEGQHGNVFFHISECDEMDTANVPVGICVAFDMGTSRDGRSVAINVKEI